MSRTIDFKGIFKHAMQEGADCVAMKSVGGYAIFNLYSNGVTTEYFGEKPSEYMELGRVFKYKLFDSNREFNELLNGLYLDEDEEIEVSLFTRDNEHIFHSYKFILEEKHESK